MRNRPQAASLAIVVILIVGVIVLLGLALLGWYISGYNRAVRLEQSTEEAWGNVDTQLQRRADLVPQLVNTVRGIIQQERAIFGEIAEARTRYMNAQTVEGKIEASNALSSLLPKILALREAYPELKSNQNFLALQDQLEGSENRIAVARTRYNEAVRALNTYTKELIGSWFAKKAGVEAKPYFEAAETAEKPPEVDFSTTPTER